MRNVRRVVNERTNRNRPASHAKSRAVVGPLESVSLRGEQGRRYEPYFKPDWNPDLFLGQNFLAVKGRTEGVKIYEPVGKQGEVGESVLGDIERFHKALDLYRRQRWEEAEAMLKALAYAAPDYKLYKLYLKRLSHFRENTPGPAWNGQWVFTTK